MKVDGEFAVLFRIESARLGRLLLICFSGFKNNHILLDFSVIFFFSHAIERKKSVYTDFFSMSSDVDIAVPDKGAKMHNPFSQNVL